MTMNPEDLSPGLRIDYDGRAVRLKWHKLRRSATDFPFSRDNLSRGLALGASLEVDLRQLACGRFVCLHDQRLERETNGSGRVRRLDGEAVGQLRLRHPRSGELGEAPMLLDELVAEVTRMADGIAPDTVIQLDLKERDDAVSDAAASAFADLMTPVASHFLLSADDWSATRRLGEAAGLALGFELNSLARTRDLTDREKVAGLAFAVAAEAPEAKVVYVNRDVLRAGLAQGVNLVTQLKAYGYDVDCWTIDADDRGGSDDLRMAVEAGADQVTTNSPRALQALWRDLQP